MLSYDKWLSKNYDELLNILVHFAVVPSGQMIRASIVSGTLDERANTGCALCMFKDGRKPPQFSVG